MIDMPKICLISGNDRNIGKSTLACKIIKLNCSKNQIFAIKISSHIHQQNSNVKFIVHEHDLQIFEECNYKSNKDSSLFLQAGAKKVLYVQYISNGLDKAMPFIFNFIGDNFCVIESGGIRSYIKPGLFLFIHNVNSLKVTEHKPHANLIIEPHSFNNLTITIKNSQWNIL